MPITEVERSEMVNELSAVSSPKTVATLMKCVLPDGRDHLATKDDIKVVEHSLRSDFAELKSEFADLRAEFAELKAHVDSSLAEIRAHVDTALAKQARLMMTTLVSFMLTTWTTMLIFLAV